VSVKRLPPDDLAVAKPVGPRPLALVTDLARVEPPDLGPPDPDHSVPSRYEAFRDDARLHVFVSRFEPFAHLVVTAQPGPAWRLYRL
jgi:hypothetical protein